MPGDLLSLISKVEHVGRTSVSVSVEVFSEQLHNQGEYRKVTQARLTYVAIDAKGRPKSIPKAAASTAQGPAPDKKTLKSRHAKGRAASGASSL
jgi:acyl-CoA thioesterase YciA